MNLGQNIIYRDVDKDGNPLPKEPVKFQPIRLRPFTTDYATAMRATAKALGDPRIALKTKPNEHVLRLTNLA